MERVNKFLYSTLEIELENKPEEVQRQVKRQLNKVYSDILKQLKTVPDVKVNKEKESNDTTR